MITNQTTVDMYPDGRMDTKNAAKYTGYSEKTLAMMRSNGVGPEYIKRGKVFYYKDAIDDWFQAGLRKTY